MRLTAIVAVLVGWALVAGSTQEKAATPVSFKSDVFPLIQKYCLPCHSEDESNPSELSLDTYDQLKQGGKHGSPIVPGKSAESLIIQKANQDPPFGKRMPLNTQRKISEGKAKYLSDEEVKIISDWVDQGAANN
ncbi:MAG TPA: c-type cytochrome domain-containing protein [Bacteroidota bacterium]|nr:c-type cytochrome domain-containing protein [Bacteroidota bacterium]